MKRQEILLKPMKVLLEWRKEKNN